MKIAIVHDWLTTRGGAERVVYQMHKLFPDAPIYTSVYDKDLLPMFDSADVRTTWLQKMPKHNKHQIYAALRPKAFRSLDLTDYDVILSSSSAESKQVRAAKNAVHICYCHTPIRYYWSHYYDYLANPGFGFLNPLVRYILPVLVLPLRRSDNKAAKKVDYFIANSNEVKDRIKKYYGRDSVVIHPPVDVKRFKPPKKRIERKGYLVVGRQVPYKRIDLAVQACSELNVPLTVIGDGSEHEHLRNIAGKNVTFLSDVDDNDIVQYFHTSKALIFPSDEDFGILPVEAMAAGMPVIAYGNGGALDSVVDGKTGLFFKQQSVKSLIHTMKKFEEMSFSSEAIVKHASGFSNERFQLELKEYIQSVRK